MMDWFYAHSTEWLRPLGRTVVSIGVGYVIGLALRDLVVVRLVRVASRTRGDWDDILVSEVRRRVPLWGLLGGLRIAIRWWAMDPVWEGWAKGAIFILAVMSVTVAATSVASRLVSTYGSRASPTLPVTSLTQNVARIIVITPGVLMILSRLGADIRATIGFLGVGGLAVALALQEPLSNLFAGLFVTLAGQVRIGDYVKLDTGAEGYVIDFNWRSTRLQVPSGNVIIVPNSKLSQAVVTNFSLPSEDLAVTVELSVDGASDLDQVERVTNEVAREVMTTVPGGVSDCVPVVRYHTMADRLVRFTAVMRAQANGEVSIVRHEFLKRVHVRYDKEGIVSPAPARTLSARDPLPVAVVDHRSRS
jgi:small-conductance mechanosensitive channel